MRLVCLINSLHCIYLKFNSYKRLIVVNGKVLIISSSYFSIVIWCTHFAIVLLFTYFLSYLRLSNDIIIFLAIISGGYQSVETSVSCLGKRGKKTKAANSLQSFTCFIVDHKNAFNMNRIKWLSVYVLKVRRQIFQFHSGRRHVQQYLKTIQKRWRDVTIEAKPFYCHY